MSLMEKDLQNQQNPGGRRHFRDIELWKNVTDEQWNDWHWQLTNTIRTLEDLQKVVNLTPDEVEGGTNFHPNHSAQYYALLCILNEPR